MTSSCESTEAISSSYLWLVRLPADEVQNLKASRHAVAVAILLCMQTITKYSTATDDAVAGWLYTEMVYERTDMHADSHPSRY